MRVPLAIIFHPFFHLLLFCSVFQYGYLSDRFIVLFSIMLAFTKARVGRSLTSLIRLGLFEYSAREGVYLL